MVKPLVVFKASAGSGKTFTLATEYIKLLVRNQEKLRGTYQFECISEELLMRLSTCALTAAVSAL